MRILLIEDETKLHAQICQQLQNDGYLVKMLQSDDQATAQYALVTLKKGNAQVWKHILFHGEYDLSRENTHDDFDLADPRIIARIYTGFWEP